MEPLGWAAAIFAAIVSIAGFVVAYFNSATRLMKRVDELTTQLFKVQDDVAACRQREVDSRQRESDLKAEVTSLTARMRSLESSTGSLPPAPLAGIIIADLHGIIREFSPALTPILGYMPKEMIGQSISACVPPDLFGQHERGFAAAVADPTKLDPTKEILTYALTKTRERVPVAITVKGQRMGNEGFITATIRQRAKGPDEGKPQ